jgi:hypothetical protein
MINADKQAIAVLQKLADKPKMPFDNVVQGMPVQPGRPKIEAAALTRAASSP